MSRWFPCPTLLAGQNSLMRSRFDMKTELRRLLAKVIVCALLVTAAVNARAQIGYQVTKGEVAGLAAVLVAVGVGVGLASTSLFTMATHLPAALSRGPMASSCAARAIGRPTL